MGVKENCKTKQNVGPVSTYSVSISRDERDKGKDITSNYTPRDGRGGGGRR
jgi:hypothetical protein